MRTLTLESDMPFGKYKGRQVEDVIEDDPSYVRWMAENSDNIEFDNEALEALEKREQRRS